MTEALRELRGATFRADLDAITVALSERDWRPLLQHAGEAALLAVAEHRGAVREVAAALVTELRARDWDGDAELADDLAAALRDKTPAGRRLPVDLQELASCLAGSEFDHGGYLDLKTGAVVSTVLTDPALVGEDVAIDLEEEPDRWLPIPCIESRARWHDMADFAAVVADEHVRDRLRLAIEGRGAFRRFRAETDRTGLREDWMAFSEERRIGRARAWLAGHGIRAERGFG